MFFYSVLTGILVTVTKAEHSRFCTSYLIQVLTGHLTGCGGADPHNSLTFASSASSEHFPHKTEKMPNISYKAAAFHPHKHKIRRD